MKLALSLPLLAATSLIGTASISKRKAVGPCMPYAETCLHCRDCSQCNHCAKAKGKCSVCWDKR